MAKTIKEMAREHEVIVVNGEYEEVRDTFIAGADSVLEEIEKLIIIGEPWCVIGENIQNRIKELKGE